MMLKYTSQQLFMFHFEVRGVCTSWIRWNL